MLLVDTRCWPCLVGWSCHATGSLQSFHPVVLLTIMIAAAAAAAADDDDDDGDDDDDDDDDFDDDDFDAGMVDKT